MIIVAFKFLVLLTPFFLLLLFIDICKNKTEIQKKQIALKTSCYIYIICMFLLWTGDFLFTKFGITIQALQIGSGIILFLSGLQMIRSNNESRNVTNEDDPSLIPLTLPITVGSGTIGYLFVLSKQQVLSKVQNSVGLFVSVVFIYLMLKYAFVINKYLGRKRLQVLSKLTGLFLCILSAQSVINGVKKVFI